VESIPTIDEVGTVRVLESGDLALPGAACFPNATAVVSTPQGWTLSVGDDDPQALDHRTGRARYSNENRAEVVVDLLVKDPGADRLWFSRFGPG